MATAYPLTEKMSTFRYQEIIKGIGKDVMAKVLKVLLQEESDPTLTSTVQQLQHIGIENKIKAVDKPKIDQLHLQDITFLYQIIFEFYKKKVNLPHDTLRDLLKKIKDLRNVVSHEDSKLTPGQLETKLVDSKRILMETITEIENLYPSHTTISFVTLKDDVINAFKKILEERVREPLDPSSPEDIKRHRKELMDYGTQVHSHVKQKTREALMGKLTTQCRSLLFEWTSTASATEPSKFSVSLKMDTERQFHGLKPTSKPTVVNQSDLLIVKGLTGEDVEVVILSAKGGAGKTTLLDLLSEKWSQEDTIDFPCLSQYSLLFSMKFRDTQLQSFDDYIKENLKQVVDEYGFHTVKECILSSQCLFLCDGYDEKNAGSRTVFEDILKLQSNKKNKVLVTSRPINTKDLTELVDKSKNKRVNLSLLGIPLETIGHCIEKLVGFYESDEDEKNKQVADLKQAFDSMAPEMKEQMMIPLYNHLIVRLLIDNPDLKLSVDTVTKLYMEIKNHEVIRFLHKIGSHAKHSVLEFMKLYYQRALITHLENKHELMKEDVEVFRDECRRLGLPFDEVMSTLFNTENKKRSMDIEPTFCYKHRTEQEFAVAHGICDMLNNVDGKYDAIHEGNSDNIIYFYLKQVSPHMNYECEDKNDEWEDMNDEWEDMNDEWEGIHKKMQDVLPFITGISNLSDKHIQNVVDLVNLEKGDDGELIIDPLMKIFSESGKSSGVMAAITIRLKEEKSYDWMIKNGNHLPSLSALMSQTKPRVLSLYLDEDPKSYPELGPNLKRIYSQLSNETEIYLYLWHHYHEGGGHSEEFLSQSLVGFCGHVSMSHLHLLGDGIQLLNLRLNKIPLNHNLLKLNTRISSLKELSDLALLIPFDEFPDRLSPLKYEGEKLGIFIDLEGNGGGDSVAEYCATKFQSIWPRRPKKCMKNIPQRSRRLLPQDSGRKLLRGEIDDLIGIYSSNFSKFGVEKFLNNLKIKSEGEIEIWDTVDISEEDERRLCALSIQKGLGTLIFENKEE